MYRRRRLRTSGKYVLPRGVKLARRRKFEPKIVTESGIDVRSQYEKRCADYLHANRITFQYEPLILLGGRQFRPDFYLPDYDLFLEICGYGHMPFYRDRTSHKRQLYEKNNLNVIFIHYSGKGSLEKILERELGTILENGGTTPRS
ncbi:MAG: hypothetical protein JSU69_02235 [Candidatus Zixiibacteriota bacterium]|nr:MAG: hypothetical protein JSU69_02235 [candidate division Zixibacteria bacterium]